MKTVNDISGGFWLIDTIVEVDVELPIEVTSDVRLERATDAQILAMKQRMPVESIYASPFESGRETRHFLRANAEGTGGQYEAVPIARDKWRYFLFTYRGNGHAMMEFYRLVCIADPPLYLRFTFHTSEEFGHGEFVGWGGNSGRPTVPVPTCDPVPAISAGTIADLTEAHSKLLEHRRQFPDLDRAIGMIHDLTRIPENSGLYYLGLFAILELLLTHNPNDRENADSLNHQLSTKIPLVDGRMSKKLNYSMFEGNRSPGRIWKLLYGLRSAIAHGSQADFSGDLRAIVSMDKAQNFVDAACRRIIRHALNEPALFRDLKRV